MCIAKMNLNALNHGGQILPPQKKKIVKCMMYLLFVTYFVSYQLDLKEGRSMGWIYILFENCQLANISFETFLFINLWIGPFHLHKFWTCQFIHMVKTTYMYR